MEFACGFVYVPSLLVQRNNQRPNVVKRSALLPPANRMRPRSPPPPPPTHTAKNKEQERSQEVKVKKSSTSFYENAQFHINRETTSTTNVFPQQTNPNRKTALLPPHMRPTVGNVLVSQPQSITYEEPLNEPKVNKHIWDPNHSNSSSDGSGSEAKLQNDTSNAHISGPALPPRPSFFKLIPEYLTLLPSSTTSPQKQSSPTQFPQSPTGKAESKPLQGNPNVVLISLAKLLSEEAIPLQVEPSSCAHCGSVLDSFDNDVNECYFCRPWDCPDPPHIPSNDLQDGLFLLNPNEKPQSADSLILFCIDVSGSMSITSEVLDGEHISRLQFVQEAVVQCVQRLSEQQPDTRVGLITFSYQVTIHGYENFASQLLSGAELTKIKHLKKVAASLPNPPPISQTREFLQRQVMGLSANGTTALGPAALLAIAMASRQPGSKVIICTDGKANAKLGNLEDEDIDAQTLLSSTIFYQELGEYAANQGVMVSVLSIEGTDCRLDELGRLADRTGGKVVIASPNRLHSEFEQIIQNRTIATQCTVTLLLPRSLRLKGEKEAGHKGTREVGNVNQDAEITFQFGANEESKYVPAPGSRVSIQLQIKHRQRNGQTVLRVFTADQEVTDDSSAVLSSLSLTIIQLNSSQASAALAVRGRLLDAKKEGEMQLKLIERAIEHNRSTEEQQTFKEWVKTMEPLYNNIHSLARNKSTISDSQVNISQFKCFVR
uniref:VWFA domain-containing protein n=1 Tax=Oryzias melastigma TaxID=30732 RepID=A0A3B3DLN0_ORYME